MLIREGPKYGYANVLPEAIAEFSVLALATYINLLWLIPQFLQRRKYNVYLGGFLLLLVVSIALFAGTIYLMDMESWQELNERNGPNTMLTTLLIHSSLEVSLMLALTSGIKFARAWFRSQQERQELETQQLQSELKFLKSQINPHFLFNTLNNLYSLTLKKSDNAPDMVLKLSEMMRYMLYDSNEKEVLLAREVDYLKNYLELERLRYGNDTHINFLVSDNLNGQTIAPLLFIPFVENSFKHGVSKSVNPAWVDVDLSVDGDFLTFIVVNNKPENQKPDVAPGIGLENVKRRLELLYPDRHHLEIEETEHEYRTLLTIKIK